MRQLYTMHLSSSSYVGCPCSRALHSREERSHLGNCFFRTVCGSSGSYDPSGDGRFNIDCNYQSLAVPDYGDYAHGIFLTRDFKPFLNPYPMRSQDARSILLAAMIHRLTKVGHSSSSKFIKEIWLPNHLDLIYSAQLNGASKTSTF